MICPKCKSEYQDGYIKCSECGFKLVKKLSSKEEYIRAKNEERKDLGGLVRFLYIIILIILAFLLIPIYDSKNIIIQKLATVFLCIYGIGGIVASFKFKIPIFGINSSSLLKDDELNMIDMVVNFILLSISIVIIFKTIIS